VKSPLATGLRVVILLSVSTLYIVATPIGNLGDISARALQVLKEVPVVACEDTRRTLQLLTHFGLKARLISCRARNEVMASEKVISVLDDGMDVAYASDAGTPALSDPGSVLVRSARTSGHLVVPIPGPSAFATLLSVAGGYDKTVIFEGFLSPKPGRRRSRVQELMSTGSAFVLYESPFRILKLLAEVADLDSERYVCVGRELTKLHEEILTGSASMVHAELAGREKILGEFSIYVSGNKSD